MRVQIIQRFVLIVWVPHGFQKCKWRRRHPKIFSAILITLQKRCKFKINKWNTAPPKAPTYPCDAGTNTSSARERGAGRPQICFSYFLTFIYHHHHCTHGKLGPPQLHRSPRRHHQRVRTGTTTTHDTAASRTATTILGTQWRQQGSIRVSNLKPGDFFFLLFSFTYVFLHHVRLPHHHLSTQRRQQPW